VEEPGQRFPWARHEPQPATLYLLIHARTQHIIIVIIVIIVIIIIIMTRTHALKRLELPYARARVNRSENIRTRSQIVGVYHDDNRVSFRNALYTTVTHTHRS